MKQPTINYEKCFLDFRESLTELKDLIHQAKAKGLEEKYRPKIIRSFEITHELAIKTIGEYFRKEGRPPFSGSRDATVEAFHENLIDDGQGWLDMIICRIKYNPLYPEDYINVLADNINTRYISLFENFENNMQKILDE